MAESYTKTECKLHGTPYCAALNMKNCADCFASKLDSEQQEALIEDIGYIAAALPEDGIESFLDEPECMLCKGSEKGKPEFFAQLSMGHDHPTVDYLDEKSNKKYKRSTAMLIPVQLPACRKCRSLLMQSYFVPIIVGVVFAAAGLVLTIIEPVRAALARFGAAIPFLFFLMFVFIGIIAESSGQGHEQAAVGVGDRADDGQGRKTENTGGTEDGTDHPAQYLSLLHI